MKYTVLILLILLLSACVIVTSSVQDAQVTGPARKSTIRIAEDKSEKKVIFRPYLYYSQTSQVKINSGTHTKVDSTGQYQLLPVAGKDYFLSPEEVNIYPFEGKNLVWQLPRYQLGLELEIFMDQFALTFGANTAMADDKRFWGGNLGIAWSARYAWWAWRTDFNMHVSRLAYRVNYINEADMIWPDTNEKHIYMLSETGEDTHWGSEFCLTLNSNRAEWPVNVWAGLGFGKQILFDLQDVAPMFGVLSYTDEYSYLAGGIYKNITAHNRIVLGIRWNYHPSQKAGIKYGELVMQYEILSGN